MRFPPGSQKARYKERKCHPRNESFTLWGWRRTGSPASSQSPQANTFQAADVHRRGRSSRFSGQMRENRCMQLWGLSQYDAAGRLSDSMSVYRLLLWCGGHPAIRDPEVESSVRKRWRGGRATLTGEVLMVQTAVSLFHCCRPISRSYVRRAPRTWRTGMTGGASCPACSDSSSSWCPWWMTSGAASPKDRGLSLVTYVADLFWPWVSPDLGQHQHLSTSGI